MLVKTVKVTFIMKDRAKPKQGIILDPVNMTARKAKRGEEAHYINADEWCKGDSFTVRIEPA